MRPCASVLNFIECLGMHRHFVLLLTFAIAVLTSIDGVSKSIHLNNNQPFEIRMPAEMRDCRLEAGSWLAAGQPAQQNGSNLVLIADIHASTSQKLELRHGNKPPPPASLELQPTPGGIQIMYSGIALGELAWDIFVENLKGKTDSEAPATSRHDFAPEFRSLPLSFQRTASGPVFNSWQAQTIKDGIQVAISLRSYHEGFLDIDTRVTNENAERTSNVYAAAICRWTQERVATRSYCYDNHISPLGERARSLFREGEGRHLSIQRGVDWVRTGFKGGQSV